MSGPRVVISQPMLFPWVGLYEQIRLADIYVHYDDVQFSKGSFTNRVQVKAPAGIKWLTIPLEGLHLNQAIREVRVSARQDWRQSHVGLLKTCYADAPYFRDMMEVVDDVYATPTKNLTEIVTASLMAGCRYFGLDHGRQFVDIATLDIPGESSQRVLDIVRKLGGDTYITGHGARNYLAHQAFEDAGVRVEYIDYQKRPYPQLHGAFTPYVSILDLIANLGKAGADVLVSGTVYWKEFADGRN